MNMSFVKIAIYNPLFMVWPKLITDCHFVLTTKVQNIRLYTAVDETKTHENGHYEEHTRYY